MTAGSGTKSCRPLQRHLLHARSHEQHGGRRRPPAASPAWPHGQWPWAGTRRETPTQAPAPHGTRPMPARGAISIPGLRQAGLAGFRGHRPVRRWHGHPPARSAFRSAARATSRASSSPARRLAAAPANTRSARAVPAAIILDNTATARRRPSPTPATQPAT